MTITHTEFTAQWQRLMVEYWTRSIRAEVSYTTRAAREQAALRRYRTTLKRLRAACGCPRCAPNA